MPPSGWRRPNSVSAKRRLADADEAGHGHDLAVAEFQRERPRAVGNAQAVDRKDGLVGVFHSDLGEIDLLAEHGIDRALIVERFRIEHAGDAAVAQADDAVGEPPDVRHAVRDVEDGDAVFAQPVDHRKQPVGLGARQRRCRLVEDQHLGLMRHGAGDRHHLAVGKRKVADLRVEIDVKSHAGGHFARLPADAARIEEELCAGAVQPVERQIGGDVERHDHAVIDVLVDRDDAGADRLCGRRRREILAVERDRAAVAWIDAADDAHQGRLAGPVRAHQNGHLAGVQVEADAAKHLCRTKGFPQVRYAEHGFCHLSSLTNARNNVGNCQYD